MRQPVLSISEISEAVRGHASKETVKKLSEFQKTITDQGYIEMRNSFIPAAMAYATRKVSQLKTAGGKTASVDKYFHQRMNDLTAAALIAARR